MKPRTCTLPGLSDVPDHLRIKVVYSDKSIIVIDKPCNLRSVPGHAHPPPSHSFLNEHDNADKKRLRSDDKDDDIIGKTRKINSSTAPQQKTAQEAWIAAIQSFAQQQSAHDSETTTAANRSIPNTSENATMACHNDDNENQQEEETKVVGSCLRKLAGCPTPTLVSVPRKRQPFQKYIQRNQSRLLPRTSRTTHDYKQEHKRVANSSRIEYIADQVYNRIEKRQRPLLNLPEPTSHKESALGQLVLMGYNNNNDNNDDEEASAYFSNPNTIFTSMSTQRANGKNLNSNNEIIPILGSKIHHIFVVHRLDCETSGIMVFARTHEASSRLSRAWRERDNDTGNNNNNDTAVANVNKIYLARVRHWPPFHDEHQLQGLIDLPLARSQTERIKWEVRFNSSGSPDGTSVRGKPSQTLWKVQQQHLRSTIAQPTTKAECGIILELKPITGRTHQLRIHCATVGSRIIGDSLYGETPVSWKPGNKNANTLCLHAHKLSIPHPEQLGSKSSSNIEFESFPSWLTKEEKEIGCHAN